MPHILIAGCGYVGEATADLFYGAGWAVEGWTRSLQSAAALAKKPYPVRAVDISQPIQIDESSGSFDVVIHCASSGGGGTEMYSQVYLEGARNLLAAFRGSKLVFTSSTSVYAQRDGSWVTEQSETNPQNETGRILLETEKLVLAHDGTVARVAGIYGPGRSALLKKFLCGTATIDSETDRFVNQVHRDDIASALFNLVNRQSTGREIYNVVDDEPIRQSDCYRWLSQRLSRPVPPIRKSAKSQKRGNSNKRVSNAKLRQAGWSPQYPTFAESMENSILSSFAEAIRGRSR
jgi:nucleoside-diphosphate-sugar epimerase